MTLPSNSISDSALSTNVVLKSSSNVFTQNNSMNIPLILNYTALPTFTSQQAGYTFSTTINAVGSNTLTTPYYLLATLTSLPIGVFTIFYTTYAGSTTNTIKIGISLSNSTASTNTYITGTSFQYQSGGMVSYYYSFNNSTLQTYYIMGYSTVVINFQTNNGSCSCVKMA